MLAASAGRVSRVRDPQLAERWCGFATRCATPASTTLIWTASTSATAVVEAGDTVGFVGNTGNARTTPPHLHLGLYRRGEGAVDPFPFIDPVRVTVPELTVDTERLGTWHRVRNGGVRLRAAPGSRGEVVRELDRYTPLRVLAGSGSFFRARLPDGTTGYVAARLTEPVAAPFARQTVAGVRSVLAGPTDDSALLARLDAGTEVPVIGRFGDYLYVRTASGETGWLEPGQSLAESPREVNPRTTSDERASQPSAISMTPRPGSAASSSSRRVPRSSSASA